MSESDHGLARNESIFREINERIEAGQWPAAATERVAFCCECGRLGCNVLVELTIREYEQVRADSRQFLLAPGHELPPIETVVRRCARYSVVQKLGEAGRVADADDPR